MKIFLFVLSCLVASSVSRDVKRIINGEAADLYSHPYIISLQQNVQTGWFSWSWMHTCGGSLISQDYVITAAHCVDMVTNIQYVRVELGALNLYESPNAYEETVAVVEIIIHPGWNPNGAGMPNDIALLRLSRPANLNRNVQIASCAGPTTAFEAGKDCVLAGWGQISTGNNAQSAETLKEVSIKKISIPECNALWSRYGGEIDFKQICVHDAAPAPGNRPSACMGDSGGPMMCGVAHNILAGVTSWGETTCSGTLPSVYTRISAFLDWIQQFVHDVHVV